MSLYAYTCMNHHRFEDNVKCYFQKENFWNRINVYFCYEELKFIEKSNLIY